MRIPMDFPKKKKLVKKLNKKYDETDIFKFSEKLVSRQDTLSKNILSYIKIFTSTPKIMISKDLTHMYSEDIPTVILSKQHFIS